jgi:small conductance mechanosensitive channel
MAATPSPTPAPLLNPGGDWGLQHGVVNSIPFKLLVVLVIALIATVIVNQGVKAIVRQTVRRADAKDDIALADTPDTTSSLRTVIAKQRVSQRARAVGQMLRSTAAFVIWSTAVIAWLQIIGINVAPLLFSASVIGVALAFGAQTLIKDFLSGMFIVIEDQYGPGDYVDLGPARGRVEEVGLRVTTLRDANGVAWYVRNGEILRVANRTQGWAPADVDITIPLTVDISTVQSIATRVGDHAVDDDEMIGRLIAKPKYTGVVFRDDEHVTVRLAAKAKPSGKIVVQEALITTLRAKLADAKIPYTSVSAAVFEASQPSDVPKGPENPRLGMRPTI